MKKKNVIILIVLIILLMALSFIFITRDDKKNENDDIKSTIIKLIDNNYKYYLLKEGHITLDGGFFIKDEIEYERIDEEWLKTFDDINNLIKDTFIKVRELDFYNNIFDKHDIIEHDGSLYINLSDNNCKIDFGITKDNITYEIKDEDTILIDLGVSRIYAYLENDKWKLSSDIYNCN